MPNYRCNRVPGGTYFFTVNLLERRKNLLVDHIDELRTSIRKTMPFHIDSWVILPDHMHCIWTLPENDNYSSVGKLSKESSQSLFLHLSIDLKPELKIMNVEYGNVVFGSIPFVMN